MEDDKVLYAYNDRDFEENNVIKELGILETDIIYYKRENEQIIKDYEILSEEFNIIKAKLNRKDVVINKYQEKISDSDKKLKKYEYDLVNYKTDNINKEDRQNNNKYLIRIEKEYEEKLQIINAKNKENKEDFERFKKL